MIRLLRRLAGASESRVLRDLGRIAHLVSAEEARIGLLSDGDLASMTASFRNRLAAGAALDDLLPEAFAVVREASKRILGMRHFDTQIMGGAALHQGRIAEMKTGEGKTLAAILPAYLNALEGKGVHVVTVNGYLARRDAERMGRVFRFLGMTVGCVHSALTDAERRLAYGCDVTYAVNNELGFDYLRDNMRMRPEETSHRGFHYTIVDEVDSILIDAARTPLVISGAAAQKASGICLAADAVVRALDDGDRTVDPHDRTVFLTDWGVDKVEEALRAAGIMPAGSLHDESNHELMSHVDQALRAHALMRLNKDYVVKDGRIVIVDEFTGRAMLGHRYAEGLHQALEAKEGLEIQDESQTLASVSLQNYFRLYRKLSGMTGTAATDADELREVYGLDVVVIPTNRPVTRVDHDDLVYRTSAERDEAVASLVLERHARRQPVLIGTPSIQRSEKLSALLRAEGVPHSVLNAKNDGEEARIVAQAGRPGAVTIATNMAGRGTDIKLGGEIDNLAADAAAGLQDPADIERAVSSVALRHSEEAAAAASAGGLLVIGTERNDSRRIDNQLRGRSGRQGDPGESQFLLSLEDDVMQALGSSGLTKLLDSIGFPTGKAIAHPVVTRAVSRAQRRKEGANFEMRRDLLKFDSVLNSQRAALYACRTDVMQAPDPASDLAEIRSQEMRSLVLGCMPERSYREQWDLERLAREAGSMLGVSAPVSDWLSEEGVGPQEIADKLTKAADEVIRDKLAGTDEAVAQAFARAAMLTAIDAVWREHIVALEILRKAVHLRASAQRDPVYEYEQEAFEMFEAMLNETRRRAVTLSSHAEIRLVRPDQAA